MTWGAITMRMGAAAVALAVAAIAFEPWRARSAGTDPGVDHAAASAQVDWSKADVVTVTMTEYRFEPDHLSFHRAMPYRLHLENRGSETHDFSATDFFRSVNLRNPGVMGSSGTVVVKPGEHKDIDFVALRPGTYELKCADHDWAGMTGMISVD